MDLPYSNKGNIKDIVVVVPTKQTNAARNERYKKNKQYNKVSNDA